ncbi:MAG: DnaJ domain-containing protein [Janthinobacterium lividum]
MSQNYYQILEVAPSAPAADIKRAYRRLATQYHPDKHGGDPRYEEQFKAVAVAYQVLSDPDRRAQYDYQLQYAARQAEEQRRAAQSPRVDPRMYGTVVRPAGTPLRTRPPAGSRERHYQRIPRQRAHFTKQDYLLSAALLALIVLFSLSVKVVMDRVTATDHYEQAQRTLADGHHALAMDLLNEALDLRADFAPALQLRGQLYQDVAHNLRAATADYEAALQAEDTPLPTTQKAHLLCRLGVCQAALRQFAAAERTYCQVLALDTTLAEAYLARGENRLLYLHQTDAALADLHQGHRQYAQAALAVPVNFLQAEGAALVRLGRYPEARAVYELALTADAQDGRTLFLLGRLAQQAGDSASGCAFFRRGAAAGYSYAVEAAQKCR